MCVLIGHGCESLGVVSSDRHVRIWILCTLNNAVKFLFGRVSRIFGLHKNMGRVVLASLGLKDGLGVDEMEGGGVVIRASVWAISLTHWRWRGVWTVRVFPTTGSHVHGLHIERDAFKMITFFSHIPSCG